MKLQTKLFKPLMRTDFHGFHVAAHLIRVSSVCISGDFYFNALTLKPALWNFKAEL